jgi:hypothetical protein|tara:strand:+ start:221 stop:520 length:300 start_codon:yes stop_codon:yes gene_type:complete
MTVLSSNQDISLQIELTGKNRSGVSSKSGTPRPWFAIGAFATLPGVKYPQAIELFTFDAASVKPAGLYSIPMVATVKDGRPAFDLDLSAAQPVVNKAPA